MCREVAMDYNRKRGEHITHDTSHAELINKHGETGSVADRPRRGRPRASTDDEVQVQAKRICSSD